jgi:hypothetical protein
MNVTYGKDPSCYICGRNEDELNHFLLDDQKELNKTLKKANKDRSKKVKTIKARNRTVHDKHLEFAEEKPENYQFTIDTVLKDLSAFEKIIPDLKELISLYKLCDKVDGHSKLIDLIKALKDHYNGSEIVKEDREIARIEYAIKTLESIKLRFVNMSTKLGYLSDVDPFEIKGTKYENIVVSINVCPLCEKAILKFKH